MDKRNPEQVQDYKNRWLAEVDESERLRAERDMLISAAKGVLDSIDKKLAHEDYDPDWMSEAGFLRTAINKAEGREGA